jgi:hypothetical protein
MQLVGGSGSENATEWLVGSQVACFRVNLEPFRWTVLKASVCVLC